MYSDVFQGLIHMLMSKSVNNDVSNNSKLSEAQTTLALTWSDSNLDFWVQQSQAEKMNKQMGSIGAAHKVSLYWSQETMTCHSSNCFSIVWGQGNALLVTSLLSSCYMTQTNLLANLTKCLSRDGCTHFKGNQKFSCYPLEEGLWPLSSTSSGLKIKQAGFIKG